MTSIVCVIVSHRYRPTPVVVGDEAPYWVCVRCGRKRYKPPRDFLDGAGHLSGPGDFGGPAGAD